MTLIDRHESLVFGIVIASVTAALISGNIDQPTYKELMFAFVGYAFARIFNHVQGKE